MNLIGSQCSTPHSAGLGMAIVRLFFAILFCAGGVVGLGDSSVAAAQPRLVVVVSVDQLAYEYLDRFRDNFSDAGFFRRAARDGAWFSDCHHRHAFTLTGPGHSVMTTGSYPFANGIIDNGWYNRQTGKLVYCVEDASQPIVGAAPGKAELKGVSPRNLLVPTVGDVLKKATGNKAKVYGITLKDRAAVLMAGQFPDLALWFDANTGNWVTSRYYRAELPKWLREINDSQLAECFAGEKWNLLYDASKYKLHHPDDAPFEANPEGLEREFPHVLEDQVNARYFKQLLITPFGNELTLRVAEQLVIQEKLGDDDVADILCVGLSANDYVGHNFGPHSLEVEDMTYRTDLLLGRFIDFLNKQVGEQRWTLVLTADHAVGPIPEYAATIGLPGKRNALDTNKLEISLEKLLVEKFGKPPGKTYVKRVDGQQVFLDRTELAADAKRFVEIQNLVRDEVKKQPAIAVAFTRAELLAAPPAAYEQIDQFRRACHPERSGDVLFALRPYHIQGKLAATHGSPWPYDSHVPLIFLGNGIAAGKHQRPASPAMIAPTLAKLLTIPPPSGNLETPLLEALQPDAK